MPRELARPEVELFRHLTAGECTRRKRARSGKATRLASPTYRLAAAGFYVSCAGSSASSSVMARISCVSKSLVWSG